MSPHDAHGRTSETERGSTSRVARPGSLEPVLLEPATIQDLAGSDGFAWLDISRASRDDIEVVGEALGLHHLAIRFLRKFDQHPRLDEFGDAELLIGYFPAPTREEDPVEFHAIVLERMLVTIHRREIGALDQLMTRFSQSGWVDRPSRATFAIAEGVAEEFDHAVERMDTHLDHLEEDMFEAPRDEHLREIQAMRAQLRALRRTIIPLRDAFGPLGRGWAQGSKEDRRYLRHAYSDLSRAERRVEALRDRATAAMDTYLSRVSHRMNQMTERLTLIGTVALPMVFLASYFGQNFDWLDDRITDFWSFAILSVLAYVLLLALAVRYARSRRMA